jgi:ribosomal protein S6
MLNQDDAAATWDDIKSFISNREGEITAEQIWGTRRLAYPIRKGNYNFLEGAYYLSSFTVDNAFNRELETYMRLDDRVLRSLIVRCDGPLPDRPAPGPLTAPSRYIPPGRGRRSDGGGPIPETPGGGFGDRAGQPVPPGQPIPGGQPMPAAAPPADASPAAAPASGEPGVDAAAVPQPPADSGSSAPAEPVAETAPAVAAEPVAEVPAVAPEPDAPAAPEPAAEATSAPEEATSAPEAEAAGESDADAEA